MDPALVFALGNKLALLGWLLLILLPRWRWSSRLIAPVIIPAAIALVYVLFLVKHSGSTEGGFGSLADVMVLFTNPNLVLVGWLHYLAFDLFIGSWEVRDAQRLGIRHRWVIPCLVLTFVIGPAGLLLYLLIRSIKTGRLWLEPVKT